MAIVGLVVGLFVSLLPERLKEHPRLQGFAGTGLHIASGLSEMAVGAAVWARGFLPHLDSSAAAARDVSQVPGFGLFGLLEYVFRPISLLCTFMIVEGLIRTFV